MKSLLAAISVEKDQTFYIIPAETYEKLMDLADDLELGRIIEERKAEKAQTKNRRIIKQGLLACTLCRLCLRCQFGTSSS